MIPSLFVVLVIVLLASTFDGSTAIIVELNVDNFEHDTQATTGATTGHWLVCLSGCTKHQELLDRLSEDEELEDMGVIVAQLKWNRKLGVRFGYTPSSRSRTESGLIVLFKKGKMYYYNTLDTHDMDEQIHHCKDFLHDQSGSESRVTPPVPSSAEAWGGVVTELIDFYKKLNGTQMQFAHITLGVTGAFLIFIVFYANATAAQAGAELSKKMQ
ncbi:hypothetical protein TrRE_jg11076 [Triparma retinervis]|uniref:Transmembrane protein n=1 Tax=Triparma retinervis TaxID=2557542 RepID=A0A9W7G5R4_9STRA|nr:hypothetical protein TrRE_jg11076 [Triparma retinervis]